MAAAPVKFGSKLNPTVQPSNGSPGIQCEPGTLTPCTMVQDEAYGRFAWIYDSDGNKMELWQPLPAKK